MPQATTPFARAPGGIIEREKKCRHPSPDGAVVDAGFEFLTEAPPRGPPQQLPDAGRRAGLSLISYWARKGRTNAFPFEKKKKRPATPISKEKRNGGKKMRQPAPVAGDFLCFVTRKREKIKKVEGEVMKKNLKKVGTVGGRRIKSKTGGTRPSYFSFFPFPPDRPSLFFSFVFFGPSLESFFFLLLLLSSHRWQTEGRGLWAKAARVLHFSHKKYGV